MNNNLLKMKKNHLIESGNKKIFLFRKKCLVLGFGIFLISSRNLASWSILRKTENGMKHLGIYQKENGKEG